MIRNLRVKAYFSCCCLLTVETADPVPPLDTAVAVLDTGSRLFADVLAGKVPHRVAASLTPLMNLLLHAIKTADLEQRMAKLEQSKLEQSKLRDGPDDET